MKSDLTSTQDKPTLPAGLIARESKKFPGTPSLWAEYQLEFDGFHTIETEKGFLTYRKEIDGQFWLRDVYVRPEFRREGFVKVLLKVASDIAKHEGATKLYGSLNPAHKHWERSLLMLKSLGFVPHGWNAELHLIIYVKVIE